MATSTNCCFNLSPRPPTSCSTSSMSPNTTQVALTRWQDVNSWRTKCVLGMTCLIIGRIETEGIIVNNQAHALIESPSTEVVVRSNEKVRRWSDKRVCPPWQANSLETIVPENLPRPYTPRRWETVGLSKVAPVVTKARTTTTGNCFSM